MNIDIELLVKKYSNWDITFSKEDTLTIIGKEDNSIPELYEFLQEITSKNSSLTITIHQDISILATITKGSKTKKYKKMYTSGCFDIFHYGHLNILEKTKKLCDHLVVGVSTDELILKEKGKLPVVPFDERCRIIEALKCVDEVIPQVDKNKQKIVDKHAIDAISVGDDWRGRFPKTSCPVEYFTYTKSVSSTILKGTLKL